MAPARLWAQRGIFREGLAKGLEGERLARFRQGLGAEGGGPKACADAVALGLEPGHGGALNAIGASKKLNAISNLKK